ncbi:universal stress protein [Algibacter pacificus]|uniref:universal stress protein n=1 Tax=Algibacter pacificus TaxID=2599389 RepID=UPI0011C85B1B|nr:universal stress protein [Algibacter pacificus]
MKTILYATDCTKNDASALKYIYRFSCIMKADLHIIHVYDLPPVSVSVVHRSEILKQNVNLELKKVVINYCKEHLKHEYTDNGINIHAVEHASVENGIVDLSKKLSPDLVVIGIKDQNSHRGIFSSNIANALLDKIEIPIMMVPNGLIYTSISTIIYATDFEKEDILPIKKLIEIVRPFKALIEIVHIYRTDTTTAKEKMERFKEVFLEQISYKEITFRTVASTKVKSGLLSVIDNENASMLAMLERKHHLNFDNIFHKDLVKDLEDSIAVPILAFHKGSKAVENMLPV